MQSNEYDFEKQRVEREIRKLKLDGNEFKIIVYKPKEEEANQDTLDMVSRYQDV